MEVKTCYSLTTRCFTLRCSHPEWLDRTQLFYNQILLFYYNLFLDLAEMDEENAANNGSEEAGISIASLNSQQLLRELEKRTVMGRDRKPVSNPLPWSRVPLYFRRAAANAGIAAGRSFLARKEQKQRADCFHEAVTYYKGTYRDFDGSRITVRVWTGETWTWLRCRLSGNKPLPVGTQSADTQSVGAQSAGAESAGTQSVGTQSADTQSVGAQSAGIQSASLQSSGSQPCIGEQRLQFLSPSVVLKPEGMFLHVPVREKVESGGNAKTRMAGGTNICSVQFTNGDSIAVCAALDREGGLMAASFLKGGTQYRHGCKRILERLEKSEASTAGQEKLKANRKYWLRLQNMSISYSHKTSRQIVDFAKKEQCGIIVLPLYDRSYQSIVMKTVGNWSPLHLGSRIRSQLSYKAWQSGILVLEADARNTSNKCAVCSAAALKRNGEEYCCANGHRGSRHVNTAVNLGRKCRESFARHSQDIRS